MILRFWKAREPSQFLGFGTFCDHFFMHSRPGYDFLVLLAHRVRTVSCSNPHGTDVLDDFGSPTRVRKILEIPLKTSSQRPKTGKKRPEAAKKRRSWEVFWGSWEHLGDLGPPGANFTLPLGRPLEPQNDTQTVPNGSKIEAKNELLKIAFQDDVGPVLGRSWVVLGALLNP